MSRLLLLLGLLTLVPARAQPASPGVLTIRFLNVGQGDSVVITSPEGKTLVYDGGRSESRMRELIRQYGVQNVSLVAASHADSDHITGLIPVVALDRPQYFLNSGLAGTTATWQKLVNTVAQAGTKGLVAADQTLNLGSVRITVLAPPPGMKDEQNLHSVGLLVQYGAFKALMTGDSETAETAGWLRKYPASFLGPIDIYKSIHHGAANGDNAAWLAAVRPTNVVVSVGPNNYGHPTRQALSLYAGVGATTWRTDQQGTVSVVVQPGGAYTVTPERGVARRGMAAGAAPTAIPASPAQAAPIPATPASGTVSYPNCAAVRAAGKSPLLRGQPGYRAGLDRDGDGRACE